MPARFQFSPPAGNFATISDFSHPAIHGSAGTSLRGPISCEKTLFSPCRAVSSFLTRHQLFPTFLTLLSTARPERRYGGRCRVKNAVFTMPGRFQFPHPAGNLATFSDFSHPAVHGSAGTSLWRPIPCEKRSFHHAGPFPVFSPGTKLCNFFRRFAPCNPRLAQVVVLKAVSAVKNAVFTLRVSEPTLHR